MQPIIPATTAFVASLVLGGCAMPLINDQAGLPRHQVQPVLTEHSLALICLGELIDQSDRPRLTVYVDRIADATVPPRYDRRRLSHGGEWWLHNAISRIGSDRVVSSSTRPRNRTPGNSIILSGAWTQDDSSVGQMDAELDGRFEQGSTRTDFFIGGRRSRDVIAGDFLTVHNGTVAHATAISLAVDSDRSGAGLSIQDGSRRVAFDFSRSTNEGPQFAQRRIAEAAVLVHIAQAFQIDFKPCAELQWSSPVAYQEMLAAYLGKSDRERNRAIQTALQQAGYAPGAVDGVWGQRSTAALSAFQAAQGMPITGRPSASVFAALQAPVQSTALGPR